MKIQITDAVHRLFAVAALTLILIAAVFAQKPDARGMSREGFADALHRRIETKNIAERGGIAIKSNAPRKGATALSNQNYFNLGNDFVLAMYDAGRIEKDADSSKYAIVELVYLIDRLENQPEAAQLQKTLKAVVRRTKTAMQVQKEIETAADAFIARQKPEQKWYLTAGKATMKLSISTYFGEDSAIIQGFAELQALIKSAPKNTGAEVLEPMNTLAKYFDKTVFTEEDYAAIYEDVGEVIGSVGA